MKPPTPIQQRYIEAIEDHWRTHGYGPTHKDLRKALGRGACTVAYMITTLERKNYVEPLQPIARTLRTTRMQYTVTIGEWPKELK